MIGRTVSHYQIVEKLGEGGMGVVYKARDTRLNRFAAIKVLSPDKTTSEDRRRRFAQEAQAASALNHPNIITIYDIVEEDGTEVKQISSVSDPDFTFKLWHGRQYCFTVASRLIGSDAITETDTKQNSTGQGTTEGGWFCPLSHGLSVNVERIESEPLHFRNWSTRHAVLTGCHCESQRESIKLQGDRIQPWSTQLCTGTRTQLGSFGL